MKQGRWCWLSMGTLAGIAGLAGTFALPATAMAGPATTIYSPIIDYREWELELKGGMFDWGHGDNGERAAKLAFGYGLMPRWGVEVEAEYSQSPGHAARVEEYEFENIFQLTEHGEHWMDAGIFAELEHNRLEHSNTLVLGPMFQKETEHTQANLNIYWMRRLSALPAEDMHDGGPGGRDELEYQVQWKYNLGPRFQPGMQAFGSLGDPAHLHSEQLRLGPAFFGVASLGNAKKLRYDAAILAGLTHGTPDTSIRFQLEYEFF
ncbi:MAG: hypothetical protein KGI62_11715 [Xanthomonadaceae bacterium]|nr:hypothetical protein [Xanthomonadaceae bacterium]